MSGGGAYDKNMKVMSLNENGKPNGTFGYKDEIIQMKANAETIMFVANDGVTLVNKSGKRFRTSNEAGSPYDACLFKHGNRVFADCGNTAKLFYCGKAVHIGENNGT